MPGDTERPDGLLWGGTALGSGADFCSRSLPHGHDIRHSADIQNDLQKESRLLDVLLAG